MDNLKDMVIDIFFNKVIKDVLNGEVNISNFTYNIEFNTVVNFNNGEYDCNNKILDETYIMAMNYGNDLNKKR